MTDLRDHIAARLEACFAASGFTEPGVDTLRDAAGVSLRTLYKYYPSREAMVVGALDHRHRAYLAFLDDGAPPARGHAAIAHLFRRVGEWMDARAPRGCLFLSAVAAYPESHAIRHALQRHKAETKSTIAARLSGQADGRLLLDELMIAHEGLTAYAVASPGPHGVEAALALVRHLAT